MFSGEVRKDTLGIKKKEEDTVDMAFYFFCVWIELPQCKAIRNEWKGNGYKKAKAFT